jgi:hypothetical protein
VQYLPWLAGNWPTAAVVTALNQIDAAIGALTAGNGN